MNYFFLAGFFLAFFFFLVLQPHVLHIFIPPFDKFRFFYKLLYSIGRVEGKSQEQFDIDYLLFGFTTCWDLKFSAANLPCSFFAALS
jgi:hypothetical protein